MARCTHEWTVCRVVLGSTAQEALAEEKLPGKPCCAAPVSPPHSSDCPQKWHLPASVPLLCTLLGSPLQSQLSKRVLSACSALRSGYRVVREPESLPSEVPWSLCGMALGAGHRLRSDSGARPLGFLPQLCHSHNPWGLHFLFPNSTTSGLKPNSELGRMNETMHESS